MRTLPHHVGEHNHEVVGQQPASGAGGGAAADGVVGEQRLVEEFRARAACYRGLSWASGPAGTTERDAVQFKRREQ